MMRHAAALSHQAHRKVAFLMPSGHVTHHDRVTAYSSRNRDEIINAHINIGDTFVFEASLRLLHFAELICIGAHSPDVDAATNSLNECDVAILRGSNYINPHMDWGNLGQVVERSRTPVVAFGIGAQAPRYEPIQMSDSSVRFLSIVSERSASIGCRGTFTASVLNDHGIKNGLPIGCPSLFRSNDVNLRVSWPPESLRRIGYSITRGFLPSYCDDIGRATRVQLRMLRRLSEEHEVYVLSQGERAEKIFYYRAYDRLEEARRSMKSCGWDMDKLPWLEDLYWRRIFFGLSPLEYESFIRTCDLVMGFRLHGNIMALSVGTPAIYVTFDSRTREIVEHFSIPHYDIMSERGFSLRDWAGEHSFDDFNRSFAKNYHIVRDFLEANAVRHRMTSRIDSETCEERAS